MKKADFIVIGAVLVVAVVLIVFLYGINSSSGDFVQIEIDGEISEVIPLDSTLTREINTEHGTNTLVIENGSAVMTEADCPDGICTNHKAINRTGESIICLPHKVVVSIINDKSDSNEIDAVA